MPAINHVLMTADAVGGVWTYVLDLTQALAEYDIRVTVALLGPAPSAAQRADAARLPNLDLRERPGRLEWMDDPWTDVDDTGVWLLGLEQTLRPDLVHINGYAYGALPWTAPVVVVGHSCVLSWWQAVHGEPAPPRWLAYATRVRNGLRGASLVVTPTTAMLNALEANYGPLTTPRAVISNGTARSALPHPKQPFVLTAGRLWDAAKNVDAVCAVANEVEWPVYVAGAFEAPADVAPAGQGPRCEAPHYLGSLASADLAEFMAQASIFVLPARYEPFGLAVLEAALAGDALVLGDIDSLREIWDDAAIFVPPDDRRQLAWTLNRLIDDDRLRSSMALRARARALQFDPRRMATQYLHAYEELTGERGSVLTFRSLRLESR